MIRSQTSISLQISLSRQTGISLIEILMVVLIISVGMTATAKFQGDLLRAGATTQARTQALVHGQNAIEGLLINPSNGTNGHKNNIAGVSAAYDLLWEVSPFAGLSNTHQYTATVRWHDNQNQEQSIKLSTLLYIDFMQGGPGADDSVRIQATCDLFGC
ncbi:type IV pilus modification PilV family protein [Oceanospirillum maris]|jgi:Tfp pilus assembly protein PilV|uniref:type IV pilus modification PilV family protein n=1 Tax=Oceanospirillum maris TaxID=64977 RepID=UPI0012FECE0F|nr:hypothetical protein [Oceanospirillum maris]